MTGSSDEKNRLALNAVLGVLGSGQLGMMFADAAHDKGYRVAVLSPENAAPAGLKADFEFVSDYEDEEQLLAFAKLVDAVTVEFENIPAKSLDFLSEHVAVRPASKVLSTCQNRLQEKTFLKNNQFPVTPFWVIESLEGLKAALSESAYPAILKTAGFGYDGKGQAKITEDTDIESVYHAFKGNKAVLEAFVDFQLEFSIIGVRNNRGEVVTYPAIENQHENHILSVSYCPAIQVSEETSKQAQVLTKAVLEKLDVEGVLCVEFFLTKSGDIVINEMAPRPHNSGHLTIEAFNVSQFDQQVSVLVNESLTSPVLVRPAAMINVLGDLWEGGEPDWANLEKEFPEARVHLYGKTEARKGRKMGHVTVLADDINMLETLVLQISANLRLKKVSTIPIK